MSDVRLARATRETALLSRREDSLPPPWTGTDFLLLTLVLIAALVLLAKDLTVGGPRFGDSAVHAMDGVLILDWLGAGPAAWRDPMSFAELQYAHYPALGIGTHYPPGFAVVEAAFFAVLGVSIESARLTVVCFGAALAGGVFVLVRRWWNRSAAAAAALLLTATPGVLDWGRQTMLEVPTMAALVWATVAVSWYSRRRTWPRLALALGLTVGAVAFKQPAVFLVVAVAAWLAVQALRRAAPLSHAAAAAVVAGGAVLFTILSLDGHGAQLLRGYSLIDGPWWSWESLTFYIRMLPGVAGWPVLLLAVGGAACWLRRAAPSDVLLPCLWVGACYAMLTITDHKSDRFLVVIVPPFAIWAAVALAEGIARVPARPVRRLLWCGVAVVAATLGLARPIEHRPDYDSVVAAHGDRLRHRVVLFSGLRDGDFVLAVRRHLPGREAAVVRASKILYSCNAQPELDFRSLVDSPEAVERVLESYAFAYVFVERENKLGLEQDEWLRSCLRQSASYRLIASHPLMAEAVPGERDMTIDVYERTAPIDPERDHIDIEIPRLGRSVRLSFDSAGGGASP